MTGTDDFNSTVSLYLKSFYPDLNGPCQADSVLTQLKINPLPIVVFSGLPLIMAENNPSVTLTGNQIGGNFTISPITSNIGVTLSTPVDKVVFDPSIVDIGDNTIHYIYTDQNGCRNYDDQIVTINPVTTANWDIEVPYGRKDLNQNWEVCASQGSVKIIAFPQVSLGLPGTTFVAGQGLTYNKSMALNFDGTNYFIVTDSLLSDDYKVTYYFVNTFGATDTRTQIVRILPSPISSISVSPRNCVSADVIFNDVSKMEQSHPPDPLDPLISMDTIVSWVWNFGAPENGTDYFPKTQYRYQQVGTKTVTLRVTSNQGCSNISDSVIRVGNKPIVDFVWRDICNNDSTRFEDASVSDFSLIADYVWNFGDGDIVSGILGGKIPPLTNGGRTSGTFIKPAHHYISSGPYTATLIVNTDDGCSDTIPKNLFILPYNTVTASPTSAYNRDFETSDGGWTQEAFEAINSPTKKISDPTYIASNNSWLWTDPNGITIDGGAQSSQKAWWTGNIGKTYSSNENSVVNSPCFNITRLNRPMIAFDYFSDFEKNVDGAVLQYSVDGGVEWKVIGINGYGINWHNGNAISANPGNQKIGNFGWTGTDKAKGWKNARYNLDSIPKEKRAQVRFRIAMASNDGNPSGETFDGFAFDNVFVGEKTRNVIVEQFTNNQASNIYLDSLLALERSNRTYDSTDFRIIQYHLNFPAPDPMYDDNPEQQDARNFSYGNTQAPFSVMDGRLGTFDRLYTGLGTNVRAEINPVTIDRRALSDSEFSLKLDSISTTTDSVNVQVILTSKVAYPDPVIVQAVLVDDGFASFKNVFRQGLFGREGKTEVSPWAVNVPRVYTVRNSVDVSQSRPDSLSVIAYVFDKKTKIILQSAYMKLSNKHTSVITGLAGENSSIQIYPNPSSGLSYLSIKGLLKSIGTWQLADQRGVMVLKGELENSLLGETKIDVSGLSNGMYFVKVNIPGIRSVYKKLIVNNRH